MSKKSLEDKVAVVTGAAGGIGLAVAERCAADGAHLVIGDVQVAAGESAADRLGGLFVEADLSVRADCRRLIDRALETFGAVHVLVNNAGFQHIYPLEKFPEDTWDKMIALMLTAPFLLTKYVWPTMKAQGWGRVINMNSIHALDSILPPSRSNRTTHSPPQRRKARPTQSVGKWETTRTEESGNGALRG